MVAEAMSRLESTGNKGLGGNARASRAWKGAIDENVQLFVCARIQAQDSGFCFLS
jgi:hypothetical protein